MNRFLVPQLCYTSSLCEVYLMYVNLLYSIYNPHGNTLNAVLIYFLCCLGQNCKYMLHMAPKITYSWNKKLNVQEVHDWNKSEHLQRQLSPSLVLLPIHHFLDCWLPFPSISYILCPVNFFWSVPFFLFVHSQSSGWLKLVQVDVKWLGGGDMPIIQEVCKELGFWELWKGKREIDLLP